jgi:polyketide biosynthesis enoyl-CoA hydratase PksH
MALMNQARQTIQVEVQPPVCVIRLHRPEARNTINDLLIDECRQVLAALDDAITIVVIEGSPEVFCFGADFQRVERAVSEGVAREQDPGPLYDLWLQLASGPFISVAHVRGQANAGGIGFVAACDIVLAETAATFSLSELLFGLYPACVLPFLIRRVGFPKAHYMTLMTQPINSEQALQWGLVDGSEPNSKDLLRRHLLRLRRLSKEAIIRYKDYMNRLDDFLARSRSLALAGNREVFANRQNLRLISRYVQTGLFPWETSRE